MLRLHAAEELLAFIFIAGGLSTLRDPEPRAVHIARFNFPLPRFSVRVNALLMIVGGLALVFNFHASAASSILALVLLPTTFLGHAFWLEEEQQRQAHLAHFVKNLGLLAGLLLVTLVAA
jgi:uncharacterized membrane protein YphA (DoxX/SURF4 family)